MSIIYFNCLMFKLLIDQTGNILMIKFDFTDAFS